jgi:DNA polymerase
MHEVALPRIGTDIAWRDAARRLLAAQVPPGEVLWLYDAPPQDDLFGEAGTLPTAVTPVTVPKSFIEMARTVVWHADPERFARLYALLWRLRRQPTLMSDRGDADLAHLRGMEKNVRRCAHKMKAFVRFRDLDTGGNRRAFAAWFEPTHHTVEPTAPFFAKRFGDMDWIIVTPDVTARFEAGKLGFAPGQSKPDLPEDAAEALWGTYFCNIFNPARLKVNAMTSEMPRKYWKNLPEAQYIPDLIAGAERRAREMAEAAPTLPPMRAERITQRLQSDRQQEPPLPAIQSLADLRARADEENRTIPDGYGRIILGEGPQDAQLLIVGEQPGDIEDQQGRPFVGPAGQLFDRIAAEAGLERQSAYITNAVKRFKFTPRGKRRIHQSPGTSDIEHARWWIAREIELVRPKLILAMGGTAAEMLTGTRAGILKRRGQVERTDCGLVLLTIHPAYILRLPDKRAQDAATDNYRTDIVNAVRLIAA